MSTHGSSCNHIQWLLVAINGNNPGQDYIHHQQKLAHPGQQICWCATIAGVHEGAPLLFPSYHAMVRMMKMMKMMMKMMKMMKIMMKMMMMMMIKIK
jgi:hypothetical protein